MLLGTSGLQSDLLVVEARARGHFFGQESQRRVTKKWGTAKVARFTVPKNFLGAAKIARFNLYCATKLLGTAKVARFTVPKIFLGAAKIARFSLYCETKLLGTAKVARFTVPKIFLQDLVFTVRQSFWEQQR